MTKYNSSGKFELAKNDLTLIIHIFPTEVF